MSQNYSKSNLLDEASVAAIQEEMPDLVDFYRLAEIYKVLSDPTRLKIIYSLLHRELCVNDIVKIINGNQSTVSHALANFKALNLVRYRKNGSLTLYALSDRHVEEIFSMGLEHIGEK